MLTPFGITVLTESQVLADPPKADILLLRREGVTWTPEQQSLLPDGVRDRQASHHLLECKITESVSELALQQALTYDYLYGQTQKLSETELQTYLVCSHTPRPATLQSWGYVLGEQPGVYVTTLPVLRKLVLIVLNELSDAPHNDFVKLFASRKRVRKNAFRVLLQRYLNKWSVQLLTLIFGLQKLYRMEDSTMTRMMTVEDVLDIGEEEMKVVLTHAPPSIRLAGLAPEDRLAGLAPEDRLAGLTPEEIWRLLAKNNQAQRQAIRNAPLAERLEGLSRQEIAALHAQIEAYLQQQGEPVQQPEGETPNRDPKR